MKIHKIPLLMGIIGLMIIVLSIYRWWFVWYDPSQMIIMSGFGLGIFIFGYIYNWMKVIDDKIKIEIEKFKDTLAGFAKTFGMREFE